MDSPIRRCRTGAALGALALALLAASAQAGSRTTSGNLLTNGDAESGSAANDQNGVIAPTGWQTTGGFTALVYGAPGGFPTAGQGPQLAGNAFFAGGSGWSISTASQNVDVSKYAKLIDARNLEATLSADLGGWEAQGDTATVQASFLDAAGKLLGSFSIGPVTSSDRGEQTRFEHRTADARVAIGTRTIQVEITMDREAGVYNDGYADNVALSVDAAEAPVSAVPVAFSFRARKTDSWFRAATGRGRLLASQPDANDWQRVIEVSSSEIVVRVQLPDERPQTVTLRALPGGVYGNRRLTLPVRVVGSTWSRCHEGATGSLYAEDIDNVVKIAGVCSRAFFAWGRGDATVSFK